MTTTYTFDNLIADVTKEAAALRVHATEEERGRLDVKRMDPTDTRLCYYGLMTGDCDSERATELIKKCAPIYVHNDSSVRMVITEIEFKHFHWSPIEWYITLPEAKNAELISYLRGETETLDL